MDKIKEKLHIGSSSGKKNVEAETYGEQRVGTIEGMFVCLLSFSLPFPFLLLLPFSFGLFV